MLCDPAWSCYTGTGDVGSMGDAALRGSTLNLQGKETSSCERLTCVLMQPWMYFPAEFTVALYKIRCDRLGNNISADFFFFAKVVAVEYRCCF